jgi:hypothetical protein
MTSLTFIYFYKCHTVSLLVMMIRVSFNGAWSMMMVKAPAGLAIEHIDNILQIPSNAGGLCRKREVI